MICFKCGSNNDVIDLVIDQKQTFLCMPCRYKLFGGQAGNSVITKSVELTLSSKDWKWLERQADGNYSNMLERLIFQSMFGERTWMNEACLGYVILGARDIGLSDQHIDQLVRAIRYHFDASGIDEAAEIYKRSSY